MNAEVVVKAGLGIWERSWGWGLGWGDERLVKGEEIGARVKELMGDEKLRGRAKKVGEEAIKAYGVSGSSEKVLIGVIELLNQKMRN
ncbi:hypothetical protein L1049_002873 [Liquidambar formosana]|uniref:Uncharacterized protein n=1 Tax=Liquidambar formosana TaxID=63359 RepID=A0AAP0NGL7_LIQFO